MNTSESCVFKVVVRVRNWNNYNLSQQMYTILLELQ